MVRKGSPVQVRLRALLGGPSLVIHAGAGAGSEHPVEGEVILGRDHSSADLVIQDPGVSRRHARVATDDAGIFLEDLGSSNGTYVNGQRVSGAVDLAAGDEIQVGGTVLGIEGGTAATALMPPAAPPTERHPEPATRRPAPRRLAPHPTERGNVPALAALFLGPLSILILALSPGGFFIALPCAVAAVVLGTIGIHNVDRGKATDHRGLARFGRFTGWLGTILSLLALIVFVIVATALHSTENSVGGLIQRIKDEINDVHVPQAPDVNAPSAPTSSGSGSAGDSSSSGSSGGTAPPRQ